MARSKKAAVSPEVRKDWLKRFEEDGQSPPQIAGADGYDVRTVRRQIEQARQEREAKEVRRAVLSTALNAHYHDLIDWARKLDNTISRPPTRVPPDWLDHPLCQALREHLPRSPIWRSLLIWEELMGRYDQLVEEVENRARVAAQSRGYTFTSTRSESGLTEGLLRAIVEDVTSRAQGQKSLRDIAEFSCQSATRIGSGLYEVRMGAYLLAYMLPGEADKFKITYFEILDDTVNWEQTGQLRQVIEEHQRLSRVLRDELAVIIWKRVVPGRCRYCPI